MNRLVLYGYWRSSATWRVRIALNLKGLDAEHVAVHLSATDGDQLSPEHAALNPMRQVPALVLPGEPRRVVTQSVAILELLEELHPETPLLPKDPFLRARVRELVEIVNSGIQPHQNITPTSRIDALSPGAGRASARHFNQVGLTAFDALVAETAGRYCVGDTVTLADLFLVPQLYGARRWGINVAAEWPRLQAIDEACRLLDAFDRARPELQADAPPPEPS
ncbi:maleylacetoacetate isomerase [Myxococcota bacterium]|nr:maleylacetoacetate isomerase [Myxococcota bacterium]